MWPGESQLHMARRITSKVLSSPVCGSACGAVCAACGALCHAVCEASCSVVCSAVHSAVHSAARHSVQRIAHSAICRARQSRLPATLLCRPKLMRTSSSSMPPTAQHRTALPVCGWQGHRKIRGQLELAFFLLYFTHKRSNFVVSIRHLPPAGKAYDVEF